MENLYNLLSNFVKEKCINRDNSHGWLHMKNVVENSLKIYNLECIKGNIIPSYEIKQLILIVAWLHDVADHKYDHNGYLRKELQIFLNKNFPKYTNLILNIVEHISFSKENDCLKKGIDLNWINILGEEGLLIRNIVSDADKLEALGKNGFERTCKYTEEVYKKKYAKNITYDKLITNVKQHAQDKLLRLKNEFIHTISGKELAEPLHEQLKYMIDNM